MKRTIHAPVQPLVRRLEQIGGLSRQGVIATSRWVQDYRLPTASQQVLWLFPASAMIGAGVACLMASGLGVSPFDVWLSAVAERTPLSFGQAAWATSGVLFLVAVVLGVTPTARSVAFIILNGFMIDGASVLVVTPDRLSTRIALSTIGAVVLAAGVATVVRKGSAGGSFEALMVAAEQRGGRPLLVRSLLEIGFLAAGIVAGGSFGLMTVVIALGMGPVIGFGLQALDDHRVGRELRLAAQSPEPAEPAAAGSWRG